MLLFTLKSSVQSPALPVTVYDTLMGPAERPTLSTRAAIATFISVIVPTFRLAIHPVFPLSPGVGQYMPIDLPAQSKHDFVNTSTFHVLSEGQTHPGLWSSGGPSPHSSIPSPGSNRPSLRCVSPPQANSRLRTSSALTCQVSSRGDPVRYRLEATGIEDPEP